jgi:hypothetical protein
LTKSIYTLVPDIQDQLKRKDAWFTDELCRGLSGQLARSLPRTLGGTERTPTLRLSGMGDRCPRALWHSIHSPNEAEPLPPWATLKFAFGDVIEALAIQLAKAAGHDVRGEQDELELLGIKGHRDCVIDGCLVDVKSCSGRQFAKYKNKTVENSDGFGFLFQLDGYSLACDSDSLVVVKDYAYILAIHKELGHVCLYEHKTRPVAIKERIVEYKRVVKLATPPPCECKTMGYGGSGNVKLDTRASYEPFKYCCFPNLRCFLYSDGPVYLTQVRRIPDVPEVNRHGQIIH